MANQTRPTISIVIPVLREAERINRVIAHLRSIDTRGECELIVVDGSPESDTIDVIEDGGVIALRTEKGRARQMNAGAEAAGGRILLFLHADTTLPPGAPRWIKNALDDREIVAGAFRVRFEPERWVLRLFASIDNWRSRISRVPYGDQAIFVRRPYFSDCGGFRDIPLMEDVDLMRRIRRRGDRIRILDATVTTSARRWEREGVIYCTIRNCVILGLYRLGVSAHTLKRFYPDGPPSRQSRVRFPRSERHTGVGQSHVEANGWSPPIKRRRHNVAPD